MLAVAPRLVAASLPRSLPGPGRPKQRQQVAVDAVVAGDLPAKDEADREGEQHRVDRGRAREQERHVHEGPEEGRQAGQAADDQADPDRQFAKRDQRSEPGVRMVVEKGLQEGAEPLEGDRRAALALRGDRDGVGPVALERGAAVKPARAADLVVSGFQPGDEQADRQPERPARVLPNRNRVKAGPSISTSSPPGSLRISKRTTSNAMNETQKITVTAWSSVLFGSTAYQGLTIRNKATAAIAPKAKARLRLVTIEFLPSTAPAEAGG
jgi:hypothetical protein